MNTVFELLVDEAIPGHFYWTIVWRGTKGDLARVIASAPGPMPSRSWAMARGQAALRVVEQAEGEEKSPFPGRRVDRDADTVRGSI